MRKNLEEINPNSATEILFDRSSEKEFKTITNKLDKNNNIENLTVLHCDSQECLDYLIEILDKTHRLKKLEISYCTGMDEKDFKNIIKRFFEVVQKQLKSNVQLIFSLRLKNNNLNDASGSYLSSTLSPLLEKFNHNQLFSLLDISNNKINPGIVSDINKKLSFHIEKRRDLFSSHPETIELYPRNPNPAKESNMEVSNDNFAVNNPVEQASDMNRDFQNKNHVILNINFSPNNRSLQYVGEKMTPDQVTQMQNMLVVPPMANPPAAPMLTATQNGMTQPAPAMNNNNHLAISSPLTVNASSSNNSLDLTSGQNVTGDTDLQKLLKIQPTQAETSIEFNQVFTLPINRFYAALFKNASDISTNTSNVITGNTSSFVSKIKVIDTRPTRWYQQYRILQNNISEANDYLNRAKKLVDQAIENLDKDDGTDENYTSSLELALLDKRRKAKLYSKYIEELQASKQLFLRELKADGYFIREKPNYQAQPGAGFDYSFEIVKYKRNSSKYVSVQFKYDRKTSLGNNQNGNAKWTELKAELDKVLIGQDGKTGELQSKLISDQYLIEGTRLFSIENNKINYELKEINTAIEKQKAQQKELESRVKLNEQLISATKTEIERIELQITYYKEVIAQINNDQIAVKRLILLNKFFSKILSTSKVFDSSVSLTFDEVGNKNWENLSRQLNLLAKNALFLAEKIALDKESREIFTEQIVPIATEITQNLELEKQRLEQIILQCSEIPNKIHACDEKIKELFKNSTSLSENALHEERWNFLERWNDPARNGTGPLEEEISHPNIDPLSVFIDPLLDLKNTKAAMLEIYYFNLTPDGFYNQYGQSLADFMCESHGPQVVVVLPYLDQNGMLSEEMSLAIQGPKISKTKAPLPIIKFIETHALIVGWKGYALGELRHSFNLFPGERKKVVIEKQTKITTTVSSSRKAEEETKRNVTSSFEDNLQNELSTSANQSNSEEQTQKRDSSDTHNTKAAVEASFEKSSETTKSKADAWHAEAEAEASYSSGPVGGSGSVKVSGGMSGNSSRTSKNDSAKKNSSNRSKETALSISLSDEGQRSSKQSRDIASKNIQNSISKVASETSSNNKIEVTSTNSELSETSTDNKETMEVENNNIGRTINYNFFQEQNIYGTRVNLKDVKIFINTGRELIENTGINDIRVYELEEFNQIFSTLDSSDFSASLASMIVRKVLQQYSNLVVDSYTQREVLTVKNLDQHKKEIITKAYKILSFTQEPEISEQKNNMKAEAGNANVVSYSAIKMALDSLKEITFEFNESTFMEETTFTVNAPAYHLDSQLGIMSAAEPYVEERRRRESEKQQIEIEQLKANIRFLDAKRQAGVFCEKRNEKSFTKLPPASFWQSSPVNPSPLASNTADDQFSNNSIVR